MTLLHNGSGTHTCGFSLDRPLIGQQSQWWKAYTGEGNWLITIRIKNCHCSQRIILCHNLEIPLVFSAGF